jgi:hypothetical protein
VVLHGSGTQAEKSRQRQDGGVEAGVEVDVEVHWTWEEVVAMSAG